MRSVTRVLSCIQPTGDAHLGSYLGALRPWVTNQHEHDALPRDRRPPRTHHHRGARRDRRAHGGTGRRDVRRRPRSRRRDRLRPEPRSRALPAGLGDGVHGLLRRAVADDAVQGQGGPARLRLGRVVHVPGLAGGRHPAVRRRRSARRRRPAPARRDHPRHRHPLQPPLRGDVRRATSGDAARRRQGDGPPGSDLEDVEVERLQRRARSACSTIRRSSLASSSAP